MKPFKLKKPMFGSDYYPEAWDRSEIDKDLDLMVKMGLNCIRMAEFAWPTMQPSEDVYDFSLFREVVDKCKERGISVVMGTPSAIPPRWMLKNHPDMAVVTIEGRRRSHHIGRHICPNNQTYRDYLAKLVEKMAIEFKDDENIIGWQLDNEMEPEAHGGMGCCCKTCEDKFRELMRRKYNGDINALNREWGTYIRSVQYESFEDITAPNAEVTHPSFKYYWGKFSNDSLHEVLKLQHDIIHKYMDKPTGHCSMPHFNFEHEKLRTGTDVMQINQYYYKTQYGDEGYGDVLFWYDLLRTLKERPFWVTETSTCWNGGVTAMYMRPKNFTKMNVWNSYLRGAELVNFWLWRSHYGGNELMHGSVVSSCGRPLQMEDEIIRLSKDLEKISPLLCGTKVKKAEIAIHSSFTSHQMFRTQPMSPNFNYRWRMINSVYHPIEQMHYATDVIIPSGELDDYKIVITPFMPTLHENDLGRRILDWVEKGGTWIVGPMSDIRNPSAAKYTDKAMGILEDITDCRLKFTLVKGAGCSMEFKNGSVCNTIDEIYEVYSLENSGKNTEPLALYKGEFAEGYVAASSTPYGNGKIILLGALPDSDGWKSLINTFANENGVFPISSASETVALTMRSGDAGELFSAVEFMHRENAYTDIPFDGENVLTGEKYKKGERIALEPYGVLIVKKDN